MYKKVLLLYFFILLLPISNYSQQKINVNGFCYTKTMTNLEHEPINPSEKNPKHKSLEELENIAERRRFNEHPADNRDRLNEDIKEENEIRKKLLHASIIKSADN